ncbi:dockerin type I domain-containing protein [Clostridium sp. BNL1100]|uniref:dockerin type I domain-containing protein n=1 Tax=Clostridium sp. BNL1100 TaxID=755731 RepID=UPI00024A7A68|nr:dockerin type I domain-containing protein [Clostridium sp. BNL1100]AEY66126.1 alpha-galactosidase [Clostridium sp. BNL1100]
MKKIKRLIALAILTVVFISPFPSSVQNGNQVLALNNGLGLTPPMGWNSWNIFGGDINEDKIKQIADAMVTTGMKDAGYEYVNLDDNWMANPARDANGKLIPDPKRFPNGMKALADYIHSKGLKFGIYGDRGVTTCCNIPQSGSQGYEEQDAKTFAEWGVDYLKYDNCASDSNLQAGYEKMRDALLKTGRPIFYSICCWYFAGPWIIDCGNSWRTTGDISDNWGSITKNIDENSKSAAYAGPGHWNDPDMLEVGNGKMSDTEYKAHFSMWCMMAAPLIAGNDIRNMTPATKEILTNKEVIAIDQDVAGVQGTKVSTSGELEVWCKPLGVDGTTKAVILLNRGGASADITVNWRDIKLADGPATVRDLWEHKDCDTFNTGYTANVPSHGAVVLKVQTSSTDPAIMYGDVDGSGVIDALDYSLHKRYLLGQISDFPESKGKLAADVDGDGQITALDFSLIKQYLLGIINKFPAQK